MYVIKKMRINKFEKKPFVSNRDLFVAKGECSGTIVSKESADCYDQPTVDGASKTKLLGLAQDISKTAIAKAKEGDKANDMQHVNARDK